MSEKEILDKIEKSAAQEKIPESIEPEQIKRKLKENQKNKVKRRSGITYYGAVAAAALVLVIGAAGGIHAVTGDGTGLMTAPVGIEKAASGQKSDEGSEGSSELKDGATAGVEKNAQKKDAGSLYTVAKNYGEVYDAICSGSGQEKEADGIAVAEGDSSNSGDAATYIMDDTSDTVDAAVDGVEEIGGTQMIKGAGAQEGQTAADISSDTAKQRYSGTNLQKEGVDESDFVKTDGSYIYTVSHNEILITDIRKKALKQIGKIQISETSSDRVLEMYVDGDILSVIVESEDSGLEMQAVKMIVTSAFVPEAAAGGVVGTTVMAGLRTGISRGLFTNEAGLGSIPMAAATAQHASPRDQALVSMTGPFWDTVVMCAITGIASVSSMIAHPGNYAGVPGERMCFAVFRELPVWGDEMLSVSLVLFAFATIIGWNVYGECAVRYLFGEKGVRIYQVVYMMCVYFGAVITLDVVWGISDLFNFLMAVPNLICLLGLHREIEIKDTKKKY